MTDDEIKLVIATLKEVKKLGEGVTINYNGARVSVYTILTLAEELLRLREFCRAQREGIETSIEQLNTAIEDLRENICLNPPRKREVP